MKNKLLGVLSVALITIMTVVTVESGSIHVNAEISAEEPEPTDMPWATADPSDDGSDSEDDKLQFFGRWNSSKKSDNDLTFSGQYDEYVYDLGREININDKTYISVKVSEQEGELYLKFYDKDLNEVQVFNNCIGETEYHLGDKNTSNVESTEEFQGEIIYIGFMITTPKDGDNYPLKVTIDNVEPIEKIVVPAPPGKESSDGETTPAETPGTGSSENTDESEPSVPAKEQQAPVQPKEETKPADNTEQTTVVTKKDNTLKVSGKTVKVVRGKKATFKVDKVLKVSKAVGNVSYQKLSGNKKITINSKTGKVTVKKGLKKGTYKVKVKVKAAGNNDYNNSEKTVTFKVKVK